jgi:NAD(P)-dependent dehydrogenase (short-subunit alcohol dehydrogenase family)
MCELRRRRQKESVIINILDYRIKKYSSNDGSYTISKKSLEAITFMSALQWAPKVRVNGIAPGFVTPPVGLRSSKMEKSLKKVPSGSPVSVKDICSTCLYLVKTESVTGEIVYLDGGAHI